MSPDVGRRAALFVVCAVVAIGAILVLEFLPMPERTLAWNAAFDAGHAPLFGLFALALLGWLRPFHRGEGGRPGRAYVAAFVLAAVAGVLTEIAQIGTGRDADPWDVVRDVLGASSFLLFAATLDGGLTEWRARPWVPLRAILRVTAAAVLALAFVPLAVVGICYGFRDAAFPHLMDFESYWEGRFVDTRDARVTLGYLPEPWTDPTRLVGVVTFGPGAWPALDLVEPYPDWTGYDRLTLKVWSELADPVTVSVRVDDHHPEADERFDQRFQTSLEIVPGENAISIPLSDVRDGPSGRRLDLAHVRRVILYASRVERPFTLYVDDIRLE